ncbi:MAG TPA: hypothetical protein VF796_12760, partial [Humisphaera sp.]
MPRRLALNAPMLAAALALSACPSRAADAPPAARPAAVEVDLAPAGVPSVSPALQAKLAGQLKDVQFEKVPLAEAIESLRKQGDVNVYVNFKALEAAGIARDFPVFGVSVRNVTFAEALNLVLDAASAPTAKLGFCVRGNVIYVSTGEDLSAVDVSTRIYDIADLILTERARWRALNPPPTAPATQPAGGVISGPNQPDPHEPTAAEFAEGITALLMQSVAPDTWRDNGGMVGAMRELNGRLIVGQTADNHRRVEAVLAALRATSKVPGGAAAEHPAPPARPGGDPAS